MTKLRVTPRPYQQPHPPLWMTVSTDNSVTTAAEMGPGACYWQPSPSRIRQRMELYAQVRSRLEGRPFTLGEGQAVMRSMYVASSMEEARREAETAIMCSFSYNDPFRGRQVFTHPGEELDPSVRLDWDFLEPRTLLVGSPANVAGKVQELRGSLLPGLPAGRVRPPGDAASEDAQEPGKFRHQGDAQVHGQPGDRDQPTAKRHCTVATEGRIVVPAP